MKDVIESIFKFGSEFTWRKFLTLVVVSLLAFGAFLLFERYTSSFRLSRLQKASDLLVRLQEIEQKGTNNSPELIRARQTLMNEAIKAIEEKPVSLDFIPSKLVFSWEYLWKFLAGAACWWLAALYQWKSTVKSAPNHPMVGFLLIGGICGFTGIFVSPIVWPWFHILAIPLITPVAITLAIVPAALVVSNFSSAKAKAKVRLCRHNLIQLDGAMQQWALENKKTAHSLPTPEDLLPYLKEHVMPVCPSGGVYALRSVGEGPACTEKGHSLVE